MSLMNKSCTDQKSLLFKSKITVQNVQVLTLFVEGKQSEHAFSLILLFVSCTLSEKIIQVRYYINCEQMHENYRKQIHQCELYNSETFISTHLIGKSAGQNFIS